MMALDGAHTGLGGAVTTARELLRHDGIRGLYKGFGTVLCGMIPARMVYLATLESTKAGVHTLLSKYPGLSDTFMASSASFMAGGTASMVGQLVLVPIDVVSQRLMIMGGGTAAVAGSSAGGAMGAAAAAAATSGPRRMNGLELTRQIIAQEGLRGMYRGFGASVVTFVPSSAIWWASYGAWQSIIWHQLETFGVVSAERGQSPSPGGIIGVQVVSGVLTGCTSATLTNPLDVVKTRIQTRVRQGEGPHPGWRSTASALLQAEGPKGFFRGVAPRMVSTSIWGTAMVTTYEFLKRLCALPEKEES